METNIEKLLEELKTKSKDSRKYNILLGRIKKKMKKTQHFRESRYSQKSSEVVNFLKDETIDFTKKNDAIFSMIKKSDIKKSINYSKSTEKE